MLSGDFYGKFYSKSIFLLLITTPMSDPSKHYKHLRKAVACTVLKLELCRQRDRFEDFRPGFGFWRI